MSSNEYLLKQTPQKRLSHMRISRRMKIAQQAPTMPAAVGCIRGFRNRYQ